MKKITIAIVLLCTVLTACGNGQASEKECDKCGSNAVVDAIMNRRSIRKYKDTAVEKEILEQIALCGINAPNAVNAQNWAVRISTDRDFINSIRGTYNPPALIFVAGQSGVDCGLMGENMMLAAHSLGLGTCCLGGPARAIKADADMLARLDLPQGMELQFLISVGYPDEQPDAKPRKKEVIKFLE